MEDHSVRFFEAVEDLRNARDRLDRRYRTVRERGNQWVADSLRAEIQWIDERISEMVNGRI